MFDYQLDRHCSKTSTRRTSASTSIDYQLNRHCSKTAHLTIDETTGKLVASETAAGGSPVMEAVVERKRIVGGTLATAAHNYGYANEMFTARVKVLG